MCSTSQSSSAFVSLGDVLSLIEGIDGAVHNNVAYFGVYDGHGGKGCVDYLCSHLHGNILTQR